VTRIRQGQAIDVLGRLSRQVTGDSADAVVTVGGVPMSSEEELQLAEARFRDAEPQLAWNWTRSACEYAYWVQITGKDFDPSHAGAFCHTSPYGVELGACEGRCSSAGASVS
jgi:hypothetical protein